MNKDPKFHELVKDCVKAAQDCIITSQGLININSQNMVEWNNHTQEAIESYFYVSEKFKHLIDYCNNQSINDHKELTSLSKKIIDECNNMINQCNTKPSTALPAQLSALKLQIVQSIIDNSIPCIEACSEFLHDYGNDSLLP